MNVPSIEDKICVSFAKIDYEQLLKQLEFTRLAEIRTDLLNLKNSELENIFFKHSNLIVTFRCSENSKDIFFEQLRIAANSNAKYIDIEIETLRSEKEKITSLLKTYKGILIVSYHNYEQTPSKSFLLDIVDEAFSLGAGLVKIACYAQTYADCARILSLYETSKPIIAFGMGEKAKLTRLLAIQLGAPFTYVYKREFEQTAPGQIEFETAISDLKILSSKQPKFFGVIGNPILHSKSPIIFKKLFQKHNLNAFYNRILINDLSEVECLLENGFIALNVTAPFKEKILSFDENQSNLSSANCIFLRNEKLNLANTDISGIIESFERHKIELHNKKVLILGAGGAAISAIIALKNKNLNLTISNRTKDKAIKLIDKYSISIVDFNEIPDLIYNFDIIINTISNHNNIFDNLKPKAGAVILDADYKTKPLKTIAEKYNCLYINGLNWLVYQAQHAFSLFTGIQINDNQIEELFSELQNETKKTRTRIILVGLMKTGKSLIGKELAQRLNYAFFDIDEIIENETQKTINEIFEEKGEAYFRELELKMLEQFADKSNIVIAAGGGLVSKTKAREFIKQHFLAIWLFSSPKTLAQRQNNVERPLLKHGNEELILQKMLKKRMPFYAEVADLVVVNESNDLYKIAEIIENELKRI